jgi:hypothetical protein
VLLVGSNDEGTAKATVEEPFDLTAEGFEHLTQRFASRHPLEQLHFSREQTLRPPEIIDIDMHGYPANEVALCVTARSIPSERPPIGAVLMTHAELVVPSSACRH